jgi:membrane-bound lytic murein transglycosylase B
MNRWGIIVAALLCVAPASAAVLPRSTAQMMLRLTQVGGLEPSYTHEVATNPWTTYKLRLQILARQDGVRQTTIEANVPALTLNQSVIELERTEPTAHSSGGIIGALGPYLHSHVNASLIRRGRENYTDHYEGLRRIQARYGVDASILMAIWGLETSYGTVTGSTDLLQALASLGYYGRRREFFEREFVAALKLIDEGVPRWRLKGSWAGATGYPQFMPSVALRLRADGDGDGYADIWANELDGLASIASYMRDAGWKPNVTWGIPVRTPYTLDRAAIVSRTTAPRCPQVYRRHSRWLTMREWRALGVTPLSRSLPENEMASLIEPDGPQATAYLTTVNYRAILDYNCSNVYAISVGVLADAIARR